MSRKRPGPGPDGDGAPPSANVSGDRSVGHAVDSQIVIGDHNVVVWIEGRGPQAELASGSQGETVKPSGPRPPGALPAVWNVPHRLAAFTGRDAVLLNLRERISADTRVVVHALHGWGGVGKTAVAIEYAHRFADSYEMVWWIDAEQTTRIAEQMSSLAVAAGWVRQEASASTAVAAARAWFQAHQKWLVIFDNAPDPQSVHELIPQGPGHVLLTSRHPNWGQVAEPMNVDVFTRAESIALILRLAPTLATETADQIGERLGDLPLAIAQAGGVLAETGMGAAEYLEELEHHVGQAMRQGRPVDYPRSLAGTVETAVNRVGAEDAAAVQFVRLCAMLAPEPIPLELFTGAPRKLLPKPLEQVAATRMTLGACVGRLGRYGLIRPTQDGPVMHRLTRAIIQDNLDRSVRDQLRRVVETLIVTAQPKASQDPAYWPRWARLLPHLVALDPSISNNPALRDMANWMTLYIMSRSGHAEARGLAEKLYREWTVLLGPDHPHTLHAAHHLAQVCDDLSRSYELDRETLTRRRRVLSEDHQQTLHSAHALANDLRGLGRLQEALELDQDTLARQRRTLGDNHVNTLNTVHSIALDQYGLGHPEKALVLDQEALARMREAAGVGPDHPQTLSTADSVATYLCQLNRAQEALHLDLDTLKRRRRLLGEDHPLTKHSERRVAHDRQLLGCSADDC